MTFLQREHRMFVSCSHLVLGLDAGMTSRCVQSVGMRREVLRFLSVLWNQLLLTSELEMVTCFYCEK